MGLNLILDECCPSVSLFACYEFGSTPDWWGDVLGLDNIVPELDKVLRVSPDVYGFVKPYDSDLVSYYFKFPLILS